MLRRLSIDCTGSQAGSDAASERQGTPLEDVERLRQRGNSAFQRGSYSRSADLYQRVCPSQNPGAHFTISFNCAGKLCENLFGESFLQQWGAMCDHYGILIGILYWQKRSSTDGDAWKLKCEVLLPEALNAETLN